MSRLWKVEWSRVRATLALVGLMLFVGLPGCVSAPDVGDLGDDMAVAPEGPALTASIVILAVPQRSTIGVLGALVDESHVPVATRQVVVPEAESSSSATYFEGVREFSLEGGVVVSSDFMEADVAVGMVTHLAYDVSVERTDYLVGPVEYDRTSGCCLADGSVDPSCALGYVTRVYVGDGRVSYLSEVGSHADVGSGEVTAYGGVSYRVVAEREFWSSVFAVETGDMAELCSDVACDERGADGRCLTCSVSGAQSDPEGFHAPAEGVLRLRCSGMCPGAPVQALVQGEVQPAGNLYSDEVMTVGLEVESWGRERQRHVLPTLSVPEGDRPRMSGETATFFADDEGAVEVELALAECAIDGEPRRCALASDFRLAVRARPDAW